MARNKPHSSSRGGSRSNDRTSSRGPKDRPHGERPQGAKRQGERPHDDRPRGGRPQGARPKGERPQGERSYGERAQGDRPHGARPKGARSFDEKPRGERSYAEKPRGERPRDDRPKGKRPHGDRPHGDRPRGERPHSGARPERARPERAPVQVERPPIARPPIEKPQIERPPQAERPQSERPKSDAGPRIGDVWIYGYHAVAAVLANPERKILRLVATPESLERLSGDPAIPRDLIARVMPAKRTQVDGAVGENAVHQGIAVFTRTLDHNLVDVLERITDENACIVVLDQVVDPHNVGAILRSAAAFGAAAVIAPDRHAPDETGVMAKSASGALERVPYVKTQNLVRALEQLKEFGFWSVGLDAEADAELADIKLGGRIALVMGAEDDGLRRLVRETCDHVARLPMPGKMESLNVSNAAAVALYEKARQARKGGGKS